MILPSTFSAHEHGWGKRCAQTIMRRSAQTTCTYLERCLQEVHQGREEDVCFTQHHLHNPKRLRSLDAGEQRHEDGAVHAAALGLGHAQIPLGIICLNIVGHLRLPRTVDSAYGTLWQQRSSAHMGPALQQLTAWVQQQVAQASGA